MFKLKEIVELSPNKNIRVYWMRFENTEQSWYIRVNVKTKKFQVTTSLSASVQGSCWIWLGSEFKPYYRQTAWNSFYCRQQKTPVFGNDKKVQNAVCDMVNNFIKTNYAV